VARTDLDRLLQEGDNALGVLAGARKEHVPLRLVFFSELESAAVASGSRVGVKEPRRTIESSETWLAEQGRGESKGAISFQAVTHKHTHTHTRPSFITSSSCVVLLGKALALELALALAE